MVFIQILFLHPCSHDQRSGYFGASAGAGAASGAGAGAASGAGAGAASGVAAQAGFGAISGPAAGAGRDKKGFI